MVQRSAVVWRRLVPGKFLSSCSESSLGFSLLFVSRFLFSLDLLAARMICGVLYMREPAEAERRPSMPETCLLVG